jgi:hypothetical protein
MRKLTLTLLALLAFACILTPSFATEPVEGSEVASAAEVLSVFAADQVQLDLVLVLSGEKDSRFAPTARVDCYYFCGLEKQSCLVSCGNTPYCQAWCEEDYMLCLDSHC